MYKPLPANLTIKNSKIHGLGLYAVVDIPANTDLGISHVRDERFENSFIRTPLGGFFNHSDTPNCEVREVGEFLHLFTLKDIRPTSELTATYTLYKIKKTPEKNV